MRHARSTRGALGALLAASAFVPSPGCTHNYYYGATPACGPVAASPAVVDYGAVCEVPSQDSSGTTVVTTPSTRATPVLTGPRPPKIVVSEPNGSFWRRSDPEGSPAVTRVEGGVDDPTVVR